MENENGRCPVKFAALWALFMLLLVAATAVTLRSDGTVPVRPAGSTQISVDGVPVCVFRHAGQIIAGVGRCGIEVPVPQESVPPADESSPGMRLPPGHPPIDGGEAPDAPRRIPV